MSLHIHNNDIRDPYKERLLCMRYESNHPNNHIPSPIYLNKMCRSNITYPYPPCGTFMFMSIALIQHGVELGPSENGFYGGVSLTYIAHNESNFTPYRHIPLYKFLRDPSPSPTCRLYNADISYIMACRLISFYYNNQYIILPFFTYDILSSRDKYYISNIYTYIHRYKQRNRIQYKSVSQLGIDCEYIDAETYHKTIERISYLKGIDGILNYGIVHTMNIMMYPLIKLPLSDDPPYGKSTINNRVSNAVKLYDMIDLVY